MTKPQTQWPASRLRDPDFPKLLDARNPKALELYWAAAAAWHPYWCDLIDRMVHEGEDGVRYSGALRFYHNDSMVPRVDA